MTLRLPNRVRRIISSFASLDDLLFFAIASFAAALMRLELLTPQGDLVTTLLIGFYA
jgi:hypothetical protein